MSESRRDGCISSISSRSMLLIIGIDLRLDVARHLRFIGKLHGFEEVRIDVGEIHLAEVEAREFVDRETGALSFLGLPPRSEEHTSELQSLMRISYAVFCLKKKRHNNN